MKGEGIEVLGLHFSFGKEKILRGLDLAVGEGEVLAIIGMSGVGKSTLLRLMAGLEAPQAGKIYLNGRLVSEGGKILVPPHQRGMGFIFQNLALWPHLTVEEHLRFVTQDEGYISELLEFFDLLPQRQKRPHQLSGGQKQRLAIARALAQRPSFLLLDEPFSNLDLVRKKQFQREIIRLKEKHVQAVVYVTHDPFDVRALATRCAVLHEGKIIQQGPYEELIHQPAHPIVRELLEIG